MSARPSALVPGWVTGYQRSWLRGDVLAGITVTAYLTPQVMAYAELAGLPPVAGLWASIGALVVYAALGSSPHVSVGPESTTALMTAAALGSVACAAGHEAEFAAALALAVGGLCLLGWLGHLAVIAQLLSRPVLVGYVAGIALIMVVPQLGKLTGFPIEADGFFQEIAYLVRHLGSLHLPTLALGSVTPLVMLAVAAFFPRAPIGPRARQCQGTTSAAHRACSTTDVAMDPRPQWSSTEYPWRPTTTISLHFARSTTNRSA